MKHDLDLTLLKGLALPIVAPTKAPKDLAIRRVQAKPDSPQGDAYEIEWTSENAELMLRARSTPEGKKPEPREPIQFDHRLFGECNLERTGEELVSDWFSEMQDGYPAYSVVAKGLEPEDVIDFVHSLDYVRVN
jgi:hypothetical protein